MTDARLLSEAGVRLLGAVSGVRVPCVEVLERGVRKLPVVEGLDRGVRCADDLLLLPPCAGLCARFP